MKPIDFLFQFEQAVDVGLIVLPQQEVERMIKDKAAVALGRAGIERAELLVYTEYEIGHGTVYRYKLCMLSLNDLRRLLSEEYRRGVIEGAKMIGGAIHAK